MILFLFILFLQVKYSLTKNNLPVKSGNADICKEMEKEDSEVMPHLKIIGFPTQCPVEAVMSRYVFWNFFQR